MDSTYMGPTNMGPTYMGPANMGHTYMGCISIYNAITYY